MYPTLLALWLALPGLAPRAARPRRRPTVRRLLLEALEDRALPSGGYLFVPSFNTDNVLRYSESTGAFVDEFVPHKSAGLHQPEGLILGPDHNLYVSSGLFSGQPAVLRYNGTTGAFIDSFASGGPLNSPRAILFGPDGNLYVGDGVDPQIGWVDRFNGKTGAFIDQFVAPGSGGLVNPVGMVFGPDGNLYVASARNSNVLRYDGKTGAFLDQYVPTGTGGLDHALGITFGPDGRLYVASGGYDHNGKLTALAGVLRFQGPSGPQPGAYIDTFVPPGSGGLAIPVGLLFGPDGNGDGRQDLYVNSQLFEGSFDATNNSSTVLRFDGVTGAFIDTLVSADSGGLRGPGLMAFTETDPSTLAYLGATEGRSAALGAQALVANPAPRTSVNSAMTGGVSPGPALPAPAPDIQGTSGSAGQGVGGGAYFAAGGVVCLDAATLADILGNLASTTNNDIFGAYWMC
jgi:glucose/arabinose dehydrogenase